MAKAIHMMIRVLDEARSVAFYEKALGLKIADRYAFDEFHACLSQQRGNALRIRADDQPWSQGALRDRARDTAMSHSRSTILTPNMRA